MKVMENPANIAYDHSVTLTKTEDFSNQLKPFLLHGRQYKNGKKFNSIIFKQIQYVTEKYFKEKTRSKGMNMIFRHIPHRIH
ncbi:hypothetical protein RIR_e72022_A0A2I1HTL8_9GLOM [Rhizophagus irregularis DAOM 181602=DAOM 197198]|nr:hypothetical protein RIR_e72022_A0A2I1HTL8_9GLOM [Rhizophagus irregularis DAOM 181602=DAOM 197198]